MKNVDVMWLQTWSFWSCIFTLVKKVLYVNSKLWSLLALTLEALKVVINLNVHIVSEINSYLDAISGCQHLHIMGTWSEIFLVAIKVSDETKQWAVASRAMVIVLPYQNKYYISIPFLRKKVVMYHLFWYEGYTVLVLEIKWNTKMREWGKIEQKKWDKKSTLRFLV